MVKFLPRATGFIGSYEQDGYRFTHLITAEHVVSGILMTGEDIWCRSNLKNGDTGEMKIPPEAWKFYPDERIATDVAVCPFTPTAKFADGSDVIFDQVSLH